MIRLPADLYWGSMIHVIAIPTQSGLGFGYMVSDNVPVLAAIILAVTVGSALWASHWLGWLRRPLVVHSVKKKVADKVQEFQSDRIQESKTKMKTNKFAVVSALTLVPFLLGAAACPPGHSPKEPTGKEAPAEEPKKEADKKEEKKDDAKAETKAETKASDSKAEEKKAEGKADEKAETKAADLKAAK